MIQILVNDRKSKKTQELFETKVIGKYVGDIKQIDTFIATSHSTLGEKKQLFEIGQIGYNQGLTYTLLYNQAHQETSFSIRQKNEKITINSSDDPRRLLNSYKILSHTEVDEKDQDSLDMMLRQQVLLDRIGNLLLLPHGNISTVSGLEETPQQTLKIADQICASMSMSHLDILIKHISSPAFQYFVEHSDIQIDGLEKNSKIDQHANNLFWFLKVCLCSGSRNSSLLEDPMRQTSMVVQNVEVFDDFLEKVDSGDFTGDQKKLHDIDPTCDLVESQDGHDKIFIQQ